MKNFYSYKHAIASGLKRYSKFLLLAISFFMLGSSAWAAAPTEMWIRYYQSEGNQLPSDINSNDFHWMELTSIGDNKWKSGVITLNTKNLNLFYGSGESTNKLFSQNIDSKLVQFQPECATSAQIGDYYQLEKLYIGKSDGNPTCTIQIIIKYIDDTHYEILFDSPCVETDPSVTTGKGSFDSYNKQFIITQNKLNELYKDNNCNRYLDEMGVIIVDDNGNTLYTYSYVKANDVEWTELRGKEFAITASDITTDKRVCYKAYASYGEIVVYGEKKCYQPVEQTFALGTSSSSIYASSIKLTKEDENVYSTTIILDSNNPIYFIVDSEDNIWARENGKTIEAVGTAGTANEETATMTKGEKTNGTTLKATSGKTIKVTFTKEDEEDNGQLTFTMEDDTKVTVPTIRIGQQPVVDGYSGYNADLNFQLAWGCSEVTQVEVYYTINGGEPTTSSPNKWSFDTNYTDNVNFTQRIYDLRIGTYKIKARAYNSLGWSELSDMATFVIECIDPNPSIPNISFGEKTICSGSSTYIEIGNVDAGLRYSLYKDGKLKEDKILTDGKFTGISEAGIYTVKAMNNCDIESTSPAIELLVIDANSITITPTTASTNPWVPVNFTVKSTSGNPYKLVYKDDKSADVTAEMVVVKDGDDYSLKIPRPSTWEKVNASQGSTEYTVNVIQEAGETQCSSKTLTITLDDTSDNCN